MAQQHGIREIDLDVVRGVAILLAMGWHINHVSTGYAVVDWILMPGAMIGWFGVDLFFVLSGFLIGGMILREVGKTGGFNYRAFLVRRIFRLWPTLYVFLLAMLIVGGVPWQDYFWQIALHVQNYVQTKSATHLWSLAVEEHFYILLGVIFPLMIPRWRVHRWLPALLAALLILSPLLRAWRAHAGDSAVSIQTQTHLRLDALAAGVLIAFTAWSAPALFERILRRRAVAFIAAATSVAFLWCTPKDSLVGQTVGFSVAWFGAAAFLLLIYRAGLERRAPVLCRAIAFLGQVSYPLYLWHVPVMRMAEKYVPRLLGKEMRLAVVVVAYFAAIGVATVLSLLIERPLMRLRDRLIPPRVASVETVETVETVESAETSETSETSETNDPDARAKTY